MDVTPNRGNKKFNLNDERGKEWREIVEIYRKNKKTQINNARRGKYVREIEEKKRKQKKTKKLREDRMRQLDIRGEENKRKKSRRAKRIKTEKTEQNGLNFFQKEKERKNQQIVVCTIYHICAGEKHPQETQVKDCKDHKEECSWGSNK